MQKEMNERLEKVRQIIKDFDTFKISYSQANDAFNEGNKVLDECLETINKHEFKIDYV